MLQTLHFELLDHWNRSLESAFRAWMHLAETTADIIDEATGKHVQDLTGRMMTGIHAHPFLPVKASRHSQRIALVTGGLGGIGTEICRKLALGGDRVIATHIAAEAEYARKWQRERREEKLDIDVIECNVTDFDACARMAADVEKIYGGVDVLVNCAGITRDAMLRKMGEEEWHAVLDTNLDSVFNVTKNVLEGMVGRHYGRIINISSVNALKGQFGQTNYSAAKAGMYGFTRALARELAEHGITVNTVSPGYVATRMVMAVPEDIRQQIVAKIPVGRLAEPAEIAHAVAFLAAEDSGYITGTDLSVNGGLFMS